MVARDGLPPSADTSMSPEPVVGEKTMRLRGPHVPPKPIAASQIAIGAPPNAGTFLSLPSAKKASQRPSDEKNGLIASDVPAIGTASRLFIGRTNSCARPPRVPTYTICE